MTQVKSGVGAVFMGEVRQGLPEQLDSHPEKIRLLEFGPFAVANRQKRGQGKPETFNFLGFSRIWGKTRDGKFAIWRHTLPILWGFMQLQGHQYFRNQLRLAWYNTLRRRSQRQRTNWERMSRFIKKWLATPHIVHSFFPNYEAAHPR